MLKSYLAFTSAVHHVLTRAYERLGAAIARKPLLTILLSIGAISLANLGLLKQPQPRYGRSRMMHAGGYAGGAPALGSHEPSRFIVRSPPPKIAVL